MIFLIVRQMISDYCIYFPWDDHWAKPSVRHFVGHSLEFIYSLTLKQLPPKNTSNCKYVKPQILPLTA